MSVVAASADSLEDSREGAEKRSFPIAFGLTRQDNDRFGGFWDEEGDYAQPSAFILDSGGTVLISAYSSGPIGRVVAEDAVALLKMMSERKSGS